MTGFDNTTKSLNFYPPITTVEFSKAHIMYNALGLLADVWNGTAKSSQVFSPTRCIYRESSGCTSLFPADPGEYVSSQIMAEVRQGDMLNWMMDLDRFLLDCNSFTELAEHLISLPRFISANVRLDIWFSKTAIIFLRISFFLRH